MRLIRVYCGLFWLLFSLVICNEAFRLKLGTINSPGSGFFPFCVGVIMLGLSLASVFQGLKKSRQLKEVEATEESGCAEPTAEGIRWWNIVIILAAILGYALTLQTVGFLINTFLFIVLLLKVVEPQSWKTSIITGVITAIAADVLFRVIFMANLPVGITGF